MQDVVVKCEDRRGKMGKKFGTVCGVATTTTTTKKSINMQSKRPPPSFVPPSSTGSSTQVHVHRTSSSVKERPSYKTSWRTWFTQSFHRHGTTSARPLFDDGDDLPACIACCTDHARQWMSILRYGAELIVTRCDRLWTHASSLPGGRLYGRRNAACGVRHVVCGVQRIDKRQVGMNDVCTPYMYMDDWSRRMCTWLHLVNMPKRCTVALVPRHGIALDVRGVIIV